VAACSLPGDYATVPAELMKWVYSTRASTGLHLINNSQQASKYRLPVWEGDFGLDGLVKDAIETLDESGRVFERDAFEKEGLVEE
jgi:hypothetical protein